MEKLDQGRLTQPISGLNADYEESFWPVMRGGADALSLPGERRYRSVFAASNFLGTRTGRSAGCRGRQRKCGNRSRAGNTRQQTLNYQVYGPRWRARLVTVGHKA